MGNETMALTLGECANELRISQNTLTSWIKSNKGPTYIRIGRKYLFSREEVAAFLRGQGNQPPAAPTGTATN
jgi:excisionase family DNA binding protein